MAQAKHKSHWVILALLALAQFMVVLDISIVNVMLPTVQHAFHLSETSLQWIITAYTLAFGGFLLFGGRAADLFGRRRIFLIGVSAFAFCSLLDGLSQSGGMLIVLRAFQGLSAAFMSPAALSIILVNYREGHERNIALAVWGAIASGGAAVGVLLGGVLTQYAGWRWNFFINVPIGIFVFIAAARIVPKHEAEEKKRSVDILGASSVTAGLMMLVYALTKAPTYGWTDARTLAYLAVSVVLFAIFIVNEARVKEPLIPLSIFKIRNVSGANVMQVCLAAALYSNFFFATLFFQEVLNYSPVKTGVAFLAVPLSIVVTASNAPRLIKKVGYKPFLVVAPLLTATGLLWLSKAPQSGGYFAHLLPPMIIMGLGLGLTFVSVLVAATSGVAGHLSGLASGLINTAQQVGGSLGLAVLTGIAASTVAHFVTAHPKASTVTANVHGDHIGFFIAAMFSIFASLLAIVVIKQVKTPKNNEKVVIAA